MYGKENEKKVFCYRPTEGIQSYSLSNELEDFHIFPSSEGIYYATRTRLQNEGYVVRIYSSEDGQLIREIPMPYNEYGTNFRISEILICEDTAKIILLVSGWKNQDDGEWLILLDL